MSNNYKIKVNKNIKFNISKEEISKLDMVKESNTKAHVLQENKSYKTEITQAAFYKKEYTVKVNNNTYKVAIADDLDVLIKEMGFALGKSKKVNEVKSPMPGLILEMHIKVGQEVKEDETLLVLEAMKMENSIVSPRDGIIKNITVSVGEAVDKGVILVEFE